MALYNGWTPELPEDEKRRNELAALREHVVSDPDNEYWWNRLIALEAEIEADVIAHWFDESHITVRSNPALLGGVRYQKPTTSTERARSISLDGGKLRPDCTLYLSRHAVIPAASLIIPYHQFMMCNRDAEQDCHIVSFLAPSLRPLAGVPGRACCCGSGVSV